MFRRNSLLRTGKLQNNFFTVTVVPIWRAILLSAARRPEWSKVNCVATDSFFVLVSTVKSPKAQRELSASPLKPKVANDWRSGKSANLDVWCLSARTCQKQYRLQNFQSLQKGKKMILWEKKGFFKNFKNKFSINSFPTTSVLHPWQPTLRTTAWEPIPFSLLPSPTSTCLTGDLSSQPSLL